MRRPISYTLTPTLTLQDAIGEATDKKTGERELDGSKYYDVEIDSPVSAIKPYRLLGLVRAVGLLTRSLAHTGARG